MELWIRSQDREKFMKVDYFYLEQNSIIGYSQSTFTSPVLAKYKTKRRALEVLDEIQKVIMPKYIISNFPNDKVKDLNKTFKYNYDYIQSDGNINIRELGNYIYEMPKE